MSELTWTPTRVRLADLAPWERNPKRMSKAQAARLEASTGKLGRAGVLLVGPPDADGKRPLYDGHQRAKVWGALYGPATEVVALEADRALTDEERRATSLLTVTAAASFDWDALASWDVGELVTWGLDTDLLAQWNDDAANLREMLEAETEGVGAGVSVYSNEQIIEAAFAYFRKRGFPYRNLPLHVCMQEVNKLATTEPDKLLRTDTAYHVADTYHPHRFHAAAEGMKSPFEAFEDDALLRRAMSLALDNGYTLPEGAWGQLWIVSGVQTCANFRPGFAAYLYRKHAQLGSTVLDTSTGYGGRLVGFMASGIAGKYIGIDPNTTTHEGNTRMVADLGFADSVELYNLPAEDVPHDVVRGRCDFAFTSPPYFAKEHYSDDNMQSWVRYKTGDAWRDGFLLPMMALQFAALKPGSYAIVNIADVKLRNKTYPLRQWCIDAGVAVGFDHERTEMYELTHRFGAGMEDEVSKEPVIVFRKPMRQLTEG